MDNGHAMGPHFTSCLIIKRQSVCVKMQDTLSVLQFKVLYFFTPCEDGCLGCWLVGHPFTSRRLMDSAICADRHKLAGVVVHQMCARQI